MLTADERNYLVDIVGPQWVNTDPCMLDTYAFYMNPEVMNRDGGRWLPRPGAVVMPANTREVSRLVALCNKLDLMVKPLSTGWGTWAAASSDRVVVLDLKRMDRILDIDVKNQIAVVEPYVKAILLQTELFKVGLNVHVVSCGGNHSLLAASTAAWGYGLTGSSMSYSGRNLLGVEWVLPSGEVVALGSAGSGAGWFSADGPGPSLRGVMRGFSGSFGGLGVFTKAALKLYRWDGPQELKVAGASPHYRLEEIPKNLGLFALAFPSSKALADAGYKLGEAELSYAEFRLPAFMQALGTTADNLALKKLWETGTFQKIAPWSLIIAVSGQSDREFAWKLRALKEVLAETGGVNLPLQLQPPEPLFPAMKQVFKFIDDPLALLRAVPPLAEAARSLPVNSEVRLQRLSELFWVLVRHATNTQGNFRPSQSMFTSLGSFDTWDLGLKQSAWIAERKQEYIQKGLILDDGGDAGCGGTFENGHLGYLEGIGMYAAKNPESVKAVAQLIDEGTQACIKESLGIPIAGLGSVMNERFGPHCGNYHEWMKKIKQALDPNTACDPFFYVKP
jgi:FAD/FMN-containing dehydrogenase